MKCRHGNQESLSHTRQGMFPRHLLPLAELPGHSTCLQGAGSLATLQAKPGLLWSLGLESPGGGVSVPCLRCWAELWAWDQGLSSGRGSTDWARLPAAASPPPGCARKGSSASETRLIFFLASPADLCIGLCSFSLFNRNRLYLLVLGAERAQVLTLWVSVFVFSAQFCDFLGIDDDWSCL